MERLKKRLQATSALTPALLLAATVYAAANPLDGKVISGDATITASDPQTLSVTQTTDRAIIDWREFNIEAGETTRFVQPGSESWILNRVTGSNDPSRILGNLEANGNVIIVNPDGIHFGAGAQVDVNRLIATISGISNENFNTGNLMFDQAGNASASIVIEAGISIKDYGLAAFVAPSVRNSGTITARLGTINLASGNTFTIDPYGDGLVKLAIDDEISSQVFDVATGQPVSDLVKNEGILKADGGTVAMSAATARRAVNSVINNTGVIEANTVGMRGGKIVLGAQTRSTKVAGAPQQVVRLSGALSATTYEPIKKVVLPKRRPDEKGQIVVTGEAILGTSATINVSGNDGGGAVLIGGDYLGGNATPETMAEYGIAYSPFPVPTADFVVLDQSVTIYADATDNGDGGKVVVWANDTTRTTATISARGGSLGGDGGFVETSGRNQLAFNGIVDMSAPNGSNGTLLLDPVDATIGTIGHWLITPEAIETALASGDVIVTTGTGDGHGDLTVAEAVSWSSVNNLSLSAHRNIAVNAPITSFGGADVSLRADNTGTGVGTVSFGTAGQISTSGEASILYNPSVNPAGSIVNTTSYGTRNFEDYLPYVTGGGSLQPYLLVNSIEDLQNIQNSNAIYGGPPLTTLYGSFALGRDIDASDTVNWNNGAGFIPIGTRNREPNSAKVFFGTLNGLGHSITGLYINKEGFHAGLIAVLGGLVNNLKFVNSRIFGDSGPGTLSGQIFGEEGYRGPGYVENVHVINGSVQAADYFPGGLVSTNNGTIRGSSYSGTVYGINSGGLLQSNGGTIEQSYSVGSVFSSPSIIYRGGGGLVRQNTGLISDSYSGAEVSGGSILGGLAGILGEGRFDRYEVYQSGDIVNSFSFGNVLGGSDSGGLIGYVGSNAPSTIMANTYWDIEASGQLTSGGGIGLTTSALKSGLPQGFDPAIWGSDPSINNGYPHLLWQTAVADSPTTLLPVTLGDPVVPVDPHPTVPKLPQVVLDPTFTTAGSTPEFLGDEVPLVASGIGTPGYDVARPVFVNDFVNILMSRINEKGLIGNYKANYERLFEEIANFLYHTEVFGKPFYKFITVDLVESDDVYSFFNSRYMDDIIEVASKEIIYELTVGYILDELKESAVDLAERRFGKNSVEVYTIRLAFELLDGSASIVGATKLISDMAFSIYSNIDVFHIEQRGYIDREMQQLERQANKYIEIIKNPNDNTISNLDTARYYLLNTYPKNIKLLQSIPDTFTDAIMVSVRDPKAFLNNWWDTVSFWD